MARPAPMIGRRSLSSLQQFAPIGPGGGKIFLEVMSMQIEAQSHQGNRIQYPSDVRTGSENGPKSRWYVCEVMIDTLLYGIAPLLTTCATIAIAMVPAFYRVNIPYKQTRCIWAALVTESRVTVPSSKPGDHVEWWGRMPGKRSLNTPELYSAPRRDSQSILCLVQTSSRILYSGSKRTHKTS